MMEELILWLDANVDDLQKMAADPATSNYTSVVAGSQADAMLRVLDWIGTHRRDDPSTWELSAYGRGDGFHYARRRSDDGVERHPDGQPCGCPNAAEYNRQAS